MELQRQAAEKGIVALSDIEHAGKTGVCVCGRVTSRGYKSMLSMRQQRIMGCFVPMHRCIDNAIHSAAGVQLRLRAIG